MPRIREVDYDPFAEASTGQPSLKPVDYDPFAEAPKVAAPVAPASGVFPAVKAGQGAVIPPGTDLGPPPVSPPPPSDAPTSGSDPGPVAELTGSLSKGWHSFQRGRYLFQHTIGSRPEALDDFIANVMETPNIEAKNPVSPGVRKAAEELATMQDSGAGGILPSLGFYAKHPRLAINTAVESLPSMIPSMATVPLGALTGAAVGPEGAVIGARVGAGVGSAMGDFGSAYEDYARENYKPKTAEDWRAILTDPEKHKMALEYAAAHSGVVGLADAVGMGVGSKVGGAIVGNRIKNTAGKIVATGVAGAPASSAVGALGEAGGQLAGTGVTEGTPRISDPTAVAGEFAAGLVTDVGSTAVEPVIHATNLGGKPNTPPTPEAVTGAHEALMPTPAPEEVSGSMSAPGDTPIWYSPARRYIEEKGPGAATADQWAATLKNAPGVKQEELADTGLTQLFADNPGKLTKREVLDHLNENAMRITETRRDDFNEDDLNDRQRAILREMSQRAAANPTLRDQTGAMITTGNELEPLMQEYQALLERRKLKPQFQTYTLPGERQGYTELTLHTPTQNIEGDNTQRDFVGGHYTEPNVVVHARVTDRMDTNGQPMALIEEIQSDWHQAGRRQGYRDNTVAPRAPKPTGEVRYDPLGDPDFPWQVMIDGKEDNRTRSEEYARTELADRIPQLHERAQRELDRRHESRVPQGPFKTNWDELAFKRMLRWAADRGYRRIAWVNAAEQSRRYPGSAQRDAGMVQFYDKNIPSIAKRWAKRLGGTMGTTLVDTGKGTAKATSTGVGTFVVTDPAGQRLPGTHTHTNLNAALDEADRINKQAQGATVQYIDLPQAAIDVIQNGLPMYSEVAPRPGVTLMSEGDKSVENFGIQLAPALEELIKGFKLGVNVQLVMHAGQYIRYKQPNGKTRSARALGMAVGYNSANPAIHIALGYHNNAAEVWATMTHELGHIVMARKYLNAPAHVRLAIRNAYDQFLANTPHNQNMDDLIKRRDNAVVAFFQTRGGWTKDGKPIRLGDLGPSKRQYWAGFDEWFAEQVARWATSDMKPLSIVEKFFKNTGLFIAKVFQKATQKFNLPFKAEKAMADWLNSFHTDAAPVGETGNTTAQVETLVENQRHMGPEEVAVEQQPETIVAREGVNNIFQGRPPKEVQEALTYADKFNKFYKYMLGIHQVAQRNAHIQPLQEYTERISVAQLTKQQVMTRAQEVLKKWNALGGRQGDNVAALIDDVQNMVYLTPNEIAQKIVRFPSQQEFADLVKKHQVTQDGIETFKEIAETFNEHLTRYEAVLRKEANKITDIKERNDRNDAITLQIRALRSRPYFPAMRFGDYTITVKNAAGKVIHFETFERQGTRRGAVRDIEAQMAPGDTIQLGKLDRQAKPLLGVPTQLLEMMAQKLNMSTAQRNMLEQLKFELSPAQSFKHRFQHKRRVAGYSQDFRRAYAAYFFHGANHLMKAMHADELRALVKATREQTKDIYDATTRHEIVAYMNDHLENWLDPKSDWAAIRSIAFLWSLAYTPAAAAQNLTQTLMTTFPFLAQQFGDVKAIAALTRAGADFTTFYKTGKLQNATEFQLKALGRGIRDGIISEAMAPELAGYAEGRTLGVGFGGNELQRYIQKFNEYGAKLFELAEQTNRRLVFRAALKLAEENPDAKYVQDMVKKHRLNYEQLRAEGWTEAEATAYVVARDATITTQFQYGREFAPRLMRGKARSLFVFKTFMQNYLMFLANYPQAAIRSILIMGFLGGLMGVPGAQDLQEILKAIAWRLFGKDLDLEQEGRRLMIQMTGDDEFGRNAGDMVMHGVSRQGYGIPAFMDMMSGLVGGPDIPMPVFDRSAAISGGTILPKELYQLFGPPTQSVGDKLANASQGVAGAGFAPAFAIYKALANTNSSWDDSKRWEKAVPRFIGNAAKAMRVGSEGKERNAKGATIVNYDVRDTQQLMEVIGMGLGYTPLRQSLEWNRIMAGTEATKLWDIRREGLMKQMGNAVLGKDQKEIDRVKEAIQSFNKDLPTEARGKAISSDTLRQSIGTQARSRAAQEAGVSTKKADIPILREVQKLYPQSQATSVRRVPGSTRTPQ